MLETVSQHDCALKCPPAELSCTKIIFSCLKSFFQFTVSTLVWPTVQIHLFFLKQKILSIRIIRIYCTAKQSIKLYLDLSVIIGSYWFKDCTNSFIIENNVRTIKSLKHWRLLHVRLWFGFMVIQGQSDPGPIVFWHQTGDSLSHTTILTQCTPHAALFSFSFIKKQAKIMFLSLPGSARFTKMAQVKYYKSDAFCIWFYIFVFSKFSMRLARHLIVK